MLSGKANCKTVYMVWSTLSQTDTHRHKYTRTYTHKNIPVQVVALGKSSLREGRIERILNCHVMLFCTVKIKL